MRGTPPLPPLSDEYRIERLDESTTVTADDVIALWEREGAIDVEEAARRVHEVVVVAVHVPTGTLAGVATTYLKRNRQLRMDFWYFRVFVASEHRLSTLAGHLTDSGAWVVRRRWLSGEERRGDGTAADVENEGLRRHSNQAMWGSDGIYSIFVGELPNGAHVRVEYFPGALVPLPA